MAKKDIDRQEMYGWYDPSHLLKTGVRVGIATIFGEFLDRRELFGDRNSTAPADLEDTYDYSKRDGEAQRDEIWLDYAADTGDGWEPTFAVARLLARRKLDFEREGAGWIGTSERRPPPRDRIETQRGEILIFGGDEVYATASRAEYGKRLQAPFDHAADVEGTAKELANADVYALPGNHDWYDGLNAFMGLFVGRRPGHNHPGFGAGRLIGHRRTKQTRSYFALKLPGNWWILGVDAQLSGYIDQGQMSFFDDIAQRHMDDGSNAILCAAMPSWSYVDLDGSADAMFRNHAFVENVITGMAHDAKEEGRQPRRHNLRLVLTGDSHHYARYVEGPCEEAGDDAATDIAQDARCYLTWGGGGAFMHPTQQLRDVTFEWDRPSPPPVPEKEIDLKEKLYERSFVKRFTYPDPGTSKGLAFGTLLFGFKNPWFSFLMGAFGLVVAWALAGAADLNQHPLPESIRKATGLWTAVVDLLVLMASFPWSLLTCVALAAALVYFSAAQNKWNRLLFGTLHFLAYLFAFFIVFVLSCWVAPHGLSSPYATTTLVVLTGLGTALIAPFIMGCYLFISLLFRRHWNEAFSSLRIKDHKGFLRLHIKDGVVTVYPIAIDSVPKGGDGPLETRLIERPIRIAPAGVSPPAPKPQHTSRRKTPGV